MGYLLIPHLQLRLGTFYPPCPRGLAQTGGLKFDPQHRKTKQATFHILWPASQFGGDLVPQGTCLDSWRHSGLSQHRRNPPQTPCNSQDGPPQQALPCPPCCSQVDSPAAAHRPHHRKWSQRVGCVHRDAHSQELLEMVREHVSELGSHPMECGFCLPPTHVTFSTGRLWFQLPSAADLAKS